MNNTAGQAKMDTSIPSSDHPSDWQAWVWAGWETDRHYRRGGRSGTSYFGRGQWLEAWRKRLESPQTVQALADAKLNMLVTRFYKGFGIEAESQEWPAVEAFVALAHAHGLRVLGYMQGSSIYYESLLNEQPQAMSWAARHYDGTVQTWGGSYYRLRPCLNNQDYLKYMGRVIERGARQIKLDGLHIDNSYFRQCWCDQCKAGFREWLDARDDLDERMGIANASHITPPPLRTGAESYSDPLAILWMQYGAHVRNKAYAQLTAKAHEVFDSPLIAGNPAFPRRSVYLPELSLDLDHEAKIFDVLFAENGNLPAADKNHLVTQAEAYLFADAFGYKVFNTAWNTDSDAALSPQTPGELWSVMAEEFSYHAVIPGNNWWLRPASNGSELLMDQPELSASFKSMIQWFESIHKNLGRSELSQWAQVALYIQPLTLSLAWQTDRTAMRLAIAALLRLKIPVVLAIAQQPIPASVRTLLVLEQTCLSDQDMDQITQFAKQDGHGAVVMGKSGSCDQWYVPRDTAAVQSWRAGTNIRSDQGEALHWGNEQQGERYMAADKLAGVELAVQQIAAALEPDASSRQLIANLPEHVMVNVETSAARMVIHLRDQSGQGQVNRHCQLQLSDKLLGASHIRWFSPDQQTDGVELNPQPVTGDSKGQTTGRKKYMQLSLPDWKHYGVVVVSR